MKKVILSVMVVLFSTTVFANKAKVTKLENVNKFNISINVPSLENYLNLSNVQTEEAAYISEHFTYQLESSKDKMTVKKAVYVNLKSMKEVLSNKQYKMYLQVMNTTLKNKGLWDYVVTNN